jgi:hypothetical protein
MFVLKANDYVMCLSALETASFMNSRLRHGQVCGRSSEGSEIWISLQYLLREKHSDCSTDDFPT